MSVGLFVNNLFSMFTTQYALYDSFIFSLCFSQLYFYNVNFPDFIVLFPFAVLFVPLLLLNRPKHMQESQLHLFSTVGNLVSLGIAILFNCCCYSMSLNICYLQNKMTMWKNFNFNFNVQHFLLVIYRLSVFYEIHIIKVITEYDFLFI